MCCNGIFVELFQILIFSAEVSGEVTHATFHDTSIQVPISLLLISSLKTIAIRDEIINIEIGLT